MGKQLHSNILNSSFLITLKIYFIEGVFQGSLNSFLGFEARVIIIVIEHEKCKIEMVLFQRFLIKVNSFSQNCAICLFLLNKF